MKESVMLLGLAVASQLAHAAQPVELLYDLGHGQTSVITQMPAIGAKLGFELRPRPEPISPDSLRGTRLLYLRAPSKSYSDEEKHAVIAFVRGGGSLLVVFDESQRVDLGVTGLNDIITPFGLALTADTPYLHNCGGIAKAGAINRADREIPYSGGRAVEGGTPFAWQMDKDGNPAQPFAASAQLDGGARIVVMAEAMASAFMGKAEGVRLSGVPRDPSSTVYWGKDSAVFMEEVLAWLIRR